MVFRQVVFVLPRALGLLAAGVHLIAIFGIDDLSILNTCPSHRSRFCRIWFSIQVEFVNFSKFVFVMVFGQNILDMEWASQNTQNYIISKPFTGNGRNQRKIHKHWLNFITLVGFVLRKCDGLS